MERILQQLDIAGQYVDPKSKLKLLSLLDAIAIYKKDSRIIKEVRGRIGLLLNQESNFFDLPDMAGMLGLNVYENKGVIKIELNKFFNQENEFEDAANAAREKLKQKLTAVSEDPRNEDSRIVKEPRVYIPPDPGTAIRVKDGEIAYELKKIFPRLKYLEEVLQKLGINMYQDCELWIGKNTPEMMRILSYIIVIIPPEKVVELIKSKEGLEIEESEVKERMVLLCEEEGNRTFIIDKIGDVEREYLKNNELAGQEFHFYTDKTKDELQALLNIIDLIWCEPPTKWKHKVKNLLTSKKILRTPPGTGGAKGEAPMPALGVGQKEDIEKHILPRANEAGEIFDKDDNKYLNQFRLRKLIGLGFAKLKKIIKENEIRVIRGKGHTGPTTDYYSVEDIEKHILLRANKAGEIFDEEGNKYLHEKGLRKLIGLGPDSLKKIIEENEIRVIIGKSHNGVKTTNYYSVEDIEKHILARANEKGEIFDKDGNKYLNLTGLRKLISLGFKRLKKIIEDEENEIRVIRGKSHKGVCTTDYYSVEDIEKHILPRANEKGEIFDKDGNKYLHEFGLRKLIGLGFEKLKKIIEDEENEIRVIRGKSHNGVPTTDYYSVEDIEKHILPRANEKGEIFDEDGNKYLNLTGLEKLISLGRDSLKKIIEENEIRVTIGKSHNGVKTTNYYSVEDIEKHILPRANEKGEIFDEDGNKYLHLEGLRNTFNLRLNSIKKIIEENKIRVIRGKPHSRGRISKYYSVEDIEEHFYS